MSWFRFGGKVKIKSKRRYDTIKASPEAGAFEWKKDLSSKQIKMIEETCWKPMKKIGLKNYTNQNMRKDMMIKSKQEVWPLISLFQKQSTFA